MGIHDTKWSQEAVLRTGKKMCGVRSCSAVSEEFTGKILRLEFDLKVPATGIRS